MTRIGLIHWNADEATERAARLKAFGYHVAIAGATPAPGFLREWIASPPAAVVIDLSRLPGHGRDVAVGFRHRKTTRHVPLVFVEGDPEKVARVKAVLPDAVYTTWGGLRKSLEQAIAHPPANPTKPASILAGYSGTPLPKKLGIKPGSVVALVDAPPGFDKTLGVLPEGATLRKRGDGPRDLTLWFVRARKTLSGGITRKRTEIGETPMWIVWPKQASGVISDVREPSVREIGLAAGLVDYKVCAVDATWSGLLFRLRRAK